ncbi:MAG: hypothetical protein HZB39_04280 [Planctomycetes bacterium]|nr:hypothetical protein [Planctomycetota bacterium]
MRRALLFIAPTLLAVARGIAQDESPAVVDPLRREIRVPLHEGGVDTAELIEALLGAYELDVGALDLPDARIDLRGVRGRLLLLGCRKALLDTVSFARALDDRELIVVIDRVRAREVRRELRANLAKLASRLTGEDLLERRFDLALPATIDATRSLVVLVHGVESSPEVWQDLRAFLAGSDCQLATFSWPNDESCELAAAELAKSLRALGEQRVRIVGHSAGGLIARAMLEDQKLDPGNVEMLIQIGAPNAGSRLAGLRFALEAAHLLRDEPGADAYGEALLAGLRANLLDGLGEAGGDLLPDSVFLTRLARRPRNPTVRYHLVLGTRSVLSERQLEALRERAHTLLDRSPATRVAQDKLTAWIDGLDELVDGHGDGAVAVERGALDGVEPVLVPLDHVGLVRLRGLLGRIDDAADHPVFSRVRAWLAED